LVVGREQLLTTKMASGDWTGRRIWICPYKITAADEAAPVAALTADLFSKKPSTSASCFTARAPAIL
jgi:hypothetical protein